MIIHNTHFTTLYPSFISPLFKMYEYSNSETEILIRLLFNQGRSQTLNLEWAREDLFLFFSHSSIIFSHFPQFLLIFFFNLVLRASSSPIREGHGCTTAPPPPIMVSGSFSLTLGAHHCDSPGGALNFFFWWVCATRVSKSRV